MDYFARKYIKVVMQTSFMRTLWLYSKSGSLARALVQRDFDLIGPKSA